MSSLVQEELTEFYKISVEWLIKIISEGITKSELNYRNDGANLGWILESFLQGWLIISRTWDSFEKSKAIFNDWKQLLGFH